MGYGTPALNANHWAEYLGDASGTKVIYEFVDYNCGYCEKYHQELINVMKEDTSVKIVIIQMPILGNFSKDLTTIALASSLQGEFKTVHNYLYSSERKSNMEDILADSYFECDAMKLARLIDFELFSKRKK